MCIFSKDPQIFSFLTLRFFPNVIPLIISLTSMCNSVDNYETWRFYKSWRFCTRTLEKQWAQLKVLFSGIIIEMSK